MNKSEIKEALQRSHRQFIDHLIQLSEDDFMHSAQGKWTAGQQLEHIVKSVQPVNLAFSLPVFLLRIFFGKANRPSRTYDALVEKYKSKLASGGTASSRFLPNAVGLQDRDRFSVKLQSLVDSLIRKVDNFSEAQLDQFVLPHPLLGKLTLREMLCFTVYHVGHHEKQVFQNLLPQQQA